MDKSGKEKTMPTDADIAALDLVNEIEQVTGDYHSRALWWTVVRQCDHEQIRRLLSELRRICRESDGGVVNKGAYFTAMCAEKEMKG